MSTDELDKIYSLFLKQESYLNCHAELRARGLALKLRLESPKLLGWLKRYMFPWFADTSSDNLKRAEVRLDLVYADDIVTHTARLMARLNPDDTVRVNTLSKLRRLVLDDGIFLLFDEREGVVYLIDRQKRRVQVAYGFRSRWPGKVLTGAVVEILIRYLEGEGFCSYHAGAFAIDQGIILVVGEGGSGKTTLLAGMVRAGARFVANERCFVRADQQGIFALTFPQMLFVGLGTAQQFHGLDRFIADPSQLAGLQRRFSRTTVRKTPRDKQAKLDDKLGMLPTEFAGHLAGSKPLLGGKIVGIIEPAIDFDIDVTTLAQLDNSSQRQLIDRNTLERGRDKHFAHWIDLGFAAADTQIDQLNSLPGSTMKLCIDREVFRGAKDPLKLIADTLNV